MDNKHKLFISHSSKDVNIVKHIENFLCALGISNDIIFCSSIEGQGVRNGERIEATVRSEISQSKLILFVISKNFMESPYCLQELGAGWILRARDEVKTFLIKLDDIQYNEIQGFVNSDFKCSELTNTSIDELNDDIRELFSLPAVRATENTRIKNKLLQSVASHMSHLVETKDLSEVEKQEQYEKKRDKVEEDVMQNLNVEEKRLIAQMYFSDDRVANFDYTHALTGLMTAKKIIERGSVLGYPSRDGIWISCFLQPWVVKYIDRNDDLKSELQEVFDDVIELS